MSGREAAAEALVRVLLASWTKQGGLHPPFDTDRDDALQDAAFLLAAIERGDIPGVTSASPTGVRCENCGADDLACSACGALSTLVGDIPGVGVLPESETLRQVADELADWIFPDPDETRPHSAYRVALLERLHRYVGLLRSRAALAADREPDGLRAKCSCGGVGND